MGHSHRFGQKKHTFLTRTTFVVNCPPNSFVCPETGQKKHTLLYQINKILLDGFTFGQFLPFCFPYLRRSASQQSKFYNVRPAQFIQWFI